MQLREYQPSDCAQMAELFYQTVHSVNAKNYTKEQLDAWTIGEVDLQAYSPEKYAATLQEQPAYQGEANAVCVNKRPQDRNRYGGWQ